MIRLTNSINFTNFYDFDNIYPECELAYDQRSTAVTNKGEEYVNSQLIENSITGTLYANVFVRYVLTNGTEERVLYNTLKL